MKKIFILFLILIAIKSIYAYDFSAVCSTGQTLYYNITSSSTVEVTYPGNMGHQQILLVGVGYYVNASPYCVYERRSNRYTVVDTYTKPHGKVRLPRQVQHNGATYIVTGISHYAFYECNDLTLIVPEGITVGTSALEGVTTYFRSDLYHSDGLYYTTSERVTVIDYDDSIRHVVFPNTVTSIIPELFKNDTLILSVSIGDNLSYISEQAFYGCIGIDSLYLGIGLTNIANNAFEGTWIRSMYFNAKRCTSAILPSGYTSHLINIIFGDSVKYIPPSICSNAILLQSVIIPDGVENIGASAFYGCTSLESVVVPNSVTVISSSAFSNCTSLYSVAIPNSILFIGEEAFYGCASLISVSIPDSIKVISAGAFNSCTSLSSIIIPDWVEAIGGAAFYGCSSVDSIYIGTGVYTIGPNAFSGIDSVHYFHYNAKSCTVDFVSTSTSASGEISFCNNCRGVQNYSGLWDDQPLYTSYISGFQYGQKICKLIIGDSVKIIPQLAFYRDVIDTLILGRNISSMGSWSFDNCFIQYLYYNIGLLTHALRSPSQCTIGNCCGDINYNYNAPFLNTSIRTLTIGNDVRSIPDGAFRNSSIQGCVIIPDNVLSIGDEAFLGCNEIDSLYISAQDTTIGMSAFQGCSGIRNISIPNGVRTIGANAFNGCSSIDSIYLGSSLYTIGRSAFLGCNHVRGIYYNCRNCQSGLFALESTIFDVDSNKMVNIFFGDNIRSIPQSCFQGRMNISNIHLDIESIGNYAFFNCDNLLSANINTTNIGEGAFSNCDRLVSVNLGDSAISISNSAFKDCFRLNNVQMGNSVTSIGSSAFEGCVRLPFPRLSKALTYIGDNAFKGCNLISGEITIPAEVDTIGNYAFSGCSGVTALNMKPLNPPIIYEHTFDSISINIPVYVPCGRVLNYYVTDYWENFPNIFEAEPFVLEVSSNNTAMGTAAVTSAPTCSNHETIIAATANEGFHFHSWNDGNQLNPRIISLNQDTAFTAIFAVNQINVELLSADPSMGTVTGSGIYGYNNVVTATAIPNNNYHFLRWSDGNTQNPRYFTATEDITLTAIFVSNISNITVSSSNSDMGTVVGGGLYFYQQQISIMANPNYGYHFVTWDDGNTQNPRQLIVNCDTSFVATFAPNIYAVSINSLNNVMGYTAGSGNYVYNSPISFSATANYGYHFTQWNDGSTINPRTLIVTQDTSFTAQFAANSYAVAVTANDPTMGSAYGAGNFTYNTQTVISAAANYGYHFVQWSDGVTENPRMITVTNSAEYEAQFAINFYTITVGSNNPAIGTASGGGTYNYNSVINLVATPNYGYHFTQWSDGNTDNPRVITVIQNASYTAQFAINSYTVSVSGNDPARGSVSGAGSYIYNNTATISATPNYGYHFTQWNDGNTDNPRTFVVTQDVSYMAQFDYNTYTISTYSNDITIGYVTGGGTYNYNSIVALTAVPSEHYHFVQWSDSISDNPRNIIVKKDSVYTAYFAIDQHLIQVNSENTVMGNVSGTGFYNYGSGVYITASPNYGYHFTQWSDGNTQNPRHLTVYGDTAYTAQFALNSYTATILCNDTAMGHVSSSGTYNYMSHLSLLATPNYGYHFVEWNDGNTDNPRNITLTQDTIFSAQFAPNMYHVSLVANNSNFGSVSGAGDYPYLTTVAISANAYEHYHFTQWSDGNTQNPRQINVRCDTSFTALFEINSYTATILSNDTTMGGVNGGGTYNYLTALTLSATPVYGYHFVQWSDGNTDNPRSLTLTNDTVLTAQFAINIYHVVLSVNDSTLGTTSGSGDYEYLSQVLISATANANCHFVQWSDGSTSNPRQITLTTDLELTAQFSENEKFIIQVVSSDNTMGTVNGGGEYYVGTQIEIEATPYEHYRFTQWSDGVTDNPRTITVLENATYTALFEPETYEITVLSANETMGTVTGGGTYTYGSTVELRATANNGYHFVCWNDGDSNSVRTIVVEGDAEYIATFSEGVSIANHLQESISVYPNPTSGQLYISAEGIQKVEVYDLHGRLVMMSRDANTLNLSHLTNGLYTIRVYTASGIGEKKVVKVGE